VPCRRRDRRQRGLSRYRPDGLVADSADLPWLHAAADARLPGGVLSWAFDLDGVPAATVPFVEGGRYRRVLCPRRDARRAACPATGRPGNLVVAVPAGAPTVAAVTADHEALLQVDEFSCLDVSDLTGDFSGEIRTGRLHRRGRVQRIRGGAVAGNLFTLLPSARPLGPAVFGGDYHGPAGVVLEPVTVVGT